MSLRAASASALRAPRGRQTCLMPLLRRFSCTARRGMATTSAAEAPGSLPLEGYRVLDMTRVLAGVSWASRGDPEAGGRG